MCKIETKIERKRKSEGEREVYKEKENRGKLDEKGIERVLTKRPSVLLLSGD